VPSDHGVPGAAACPEQVRPAGSSDAAAVRDLVDAAYAHYIEPIGVRPVPMDNDHEAQIAAGQVFVVGHPARGAIVVMPRAGYLFVDSVAVHPAAQGSGLGRRLMEFADQHARALGLAEVRLYTHALMWENQRFYPRLGYEVVEQRDDRGYDRIFYRKALTPGR
jgi:ribosomal protein S18 acetylase RimI-like enzyme